MNYFYVKFNNDGIVVHYSNNEIENSLFFKDLPNDFRVNPTYYKSKVENGVVVGLELRDDLEEYKKQQELIN